MRNLFGYISEPRLGSNFPNAHGVTDVIFSRLEAANDQTEETPFIDERNDKQFSGCITLYVTVAKIFILFFMEHEININRELTRFYLGYI